jgi:mycofactocin precursor
MGDPVAPTDPTPAAHRGDSPEGPGGDRESLVDDELLVEEVSIDGMCGVY